MVLANFLERIGQRLCAETGGQLFSLIEMLKLLLGHGLFVPSSPEDGTKTGESVATLIDEVLRTRFLTAPQMRHVLEQATR
jgi:hypothetical protein